MYWGLESGAVVAAVDDADVAATGDADDDADAGVGADGPPPHDTMISQIR